MVDVAVTEGQVRDEQAGTFNYGENFVVYGVAVTLIKLIDTDFT